MKLVFNGKRWTLRFVRNLGPQGLCEAPSDRDKQIKIRSSLRGEARLDVLIHEAIHACAWNLDEQCVDQYATDIARMLWKLGYRKTGDKPDVE